MFLRELSLEDYTAIFLLLKLYDWEQKGIFLYAFI